MEWTVENDGFALEPGILELREVARLVKFIEGSLIPQAGRGGLRNLLEVAEIRELANSPTVRKVVTPVLGQGYFPVRGILFDKNQDANWKVPWHQDVTIAVAQRADVPGFGPWSLKSDVLHVQPPAAVLEAMVSVRLHLDPCPAANGALRVLPGTHRLGKLDAAGVSQAASMQPPVTCEVESGGALLMRPLLVHASSSAKRPGHRRVIHFDFAYEELPCGLQWAERVKTHA